MFRFYTDPHAIEVEYISGYPSNKEIEITLHHASIICSHTSVPISPPFSSTLFEIEVCIAPWACTYATLSPTFVHSPKKSIAWSPFRCSSTSIHPWRRIGLITQSKRCLERGSVPCAYAIHMPQMIRYLCLAGQQAVASILFVAVILLKDRCRS